MRGVSVCGKIPIYVAERQAKSAQTVLEEAWFEADIVVEVPKNQPF